ncbi:hypothetical protein LZ31DRAFT_209740 [Colletotrichum somersetense]|nr:hypothetical protein LZ31DRAFT_209740 [Colletotrichum somersetense]
MLLRFRVLLLPWGGLFSHLKRLADCLGRYGVPEVGPYLITPPRDMMLYPIRHPSIPVDDQFSSRLSAPIVPSPLFSFSNLHHVCAKLALFFKQPFFSPQGKT